VAAAVVAAGADPAEGLRVTATRSRLMAPLSGRAAWLYSSSTRRRPRR